MDSTIEPPNHSTPLWLSTCLAFEVKPEGDIARWLCSESCSIEWSIAWSRSQVPSTHTLIGLPLIRLIQWFVSLSWVSFLIHFNKNKLMWTAIYRINDDPFSHNISWLTLTYVNGRDAPDSRNWTEKVINFCSSIRSGNRRDSLLCDW